ncbi:hypothetical protein EMA8858_00953 [Emticicia aquatica]|uniref:Uncharacterized protein n=1 Tax=Emticicia aquatica TaxID=1681835 RepID=A0ABN8ESK1_9BACT|nr:hypothetical protein EMA8858_00953 [Emticicia aquatica]
MRYSPINSENQSKQTINIFIGFDFMYQMSAIIFNQAVTFVTTLLQFHQEIVQ